MHIAYHMADDDGGGGGRGGAAKELQRLKQQALEYYRENDVPRRLEELLNATFYLQPADVYGHLVGGPWAERPVPSGPPLTPTPPPPPPRAAAGPCACAAGLRMRARLLRAGVRGTARGDGRA